MYPSLQLLFIVVQRKIFLHQIFYFCALIFYFSSLIFIVLLCITPWFITDFTRIGMMIAFKVSLPGLATSTITRYCVVLGSYTLTCRYYKNIFLKSINHLGSMANMSTDLHAWIFLRVLDEKNPGYYIQDLLKINKSDLQNQNLFCLKLLGRYLLVFTILDFSSCLLYGFMYIIRQAQDLGHL